jgi:hypothetical protein
VYHALGSNSSPKQNKGNTEQQWISRVTNERLG